MERVKYEEKPTVVVLDRIGTQIYTTINFGTQEVENGFEAFSTTMTGEKTVEEVMSWLNDCGMSIEMSIEDMNGLFEKLKFQDRLSALKTFVGQQIESYDHSDNVNSFMLCDKRIWLDKATRVGLSNSVAIEKNAGKTKTSLWFGGVKYTITIDIAQQMLSALELYALQCYNVTAEHKSFADNATTEEELMSFDYRSGYPEKLVFNI